MTQQLLLKSAQYRYSSDRIPRYQHKQARLTHGKSRANKTQRRQMSQQLLFDLAHFALPTPEVIHASIQRSDIAIAGDPLQVAARYLHGKRMVKAIQALSTSTLTGQIYAPARIGYSEINAKIREIYGFDLAKSSIALTINGLLRLGFLKKLRGADFGAASEYQALTPAGMQAMLDGVGATHYRTTRGRVELIATVEGQGI